MLLANVCAGFISSCYGERWEWRFWGFLDSLRCLLCIWSASFASVLLLVHRAEVGGSITFVTTAGNVRQLIKLPTSTFVFVWVIYLGSLTS